MTYLKVSIEIAALPTLQSSQKVCAILCYRNLFADYYSQSIFSEYFWLASTTAPFKILTISPNSSFVTIKTGANVKSSIWYFPLKMHRSQNLQAHLISSRRRRGWRCSCRIWRILEWGFLAFLSMMTNSMEQRRTSPANVAQKWQRPQVRNAEVTRGAWTVPWQKQNRPSPRALRSHGRQQEQANEEIPWTAFHFISFHFDFENCMRWGRSCWIFYMVWYGMV